MNSFFYSSNTSFDTWTTFSFSSQSSILARDARTVLIRCWLFPLCHLVDSIDRAGFEFRFTVTQDMKKNENHRKGNTFDISRFYSRKSTEGRDQIDAVLDHKRGNECYAANGEVKSTLLRLTQNSEL